jgi:hypothetical protein
MSDNPLTLNHASFSGSGLINRLPAVSARRYELDPDAWEVFEPARRKLQDTLLWLQAEGYVDIGSDNVAEAMRKAPAYFERIAWVAAAGVARAAVGTTTLTNLLRTNDKCQT